MKPILHSLTLALLFALIPKHANAADPINFGKATVNVGATKTVSSSDETQKTMMSYATKFSWTSANTDYVQVVSSTASSCKIKGIKATTSAVKLKYTATIVMSYPPGPISFEGYFSITVNDNSTKVTEIKIIPESIVLKPLQTEQLTAQVLPENATDKSVTWTSSDSNIATVDQNGLVTAQTPGTATISASAADGSGVVASSLVQVINPNSNTYDNTDSVQNAQSALSLIPSEYESDIFSQIFPTSSITISLKNGESYYLAHEEPDFSSFAIFFGKPVDIDGLYIQGAYSWRSEGQHNDRVYVEPKKIEIPRGTLTFKSDCLSSFSGLLCIVNESGQDVEIPLAAVNYYKTKNICRLYHANEATLDGFTFSKYDEETQRFVYQEFAGQTFTENLSHIVSPISAAMIIFDGKLMEIGGASWASDAKINAYVAEFTDPVPNPYFCWKYTNDKGETKYMAIKENSVRSIFFVKEPVTSCSIVLDTDNYYPDKLDCTLNVHNVSLIKNPDYLRLKGDVNEDEKVDISDIVAIINIIAGK